MTSVIKTLAKFTLAGVVLTFVVAAATAMLVENESKKPDRAVPAATTQKWERYDGPVIPFNAMR